MHPPRPLPLFPLSVVLFPGIPLPLHVFEPRYRRMLDDCLAGDRRFGIVYRPSDVGEAAIPSGHVGCAATIEDVERLPDGRANVVVRGSDRFVLHRLLESAHPYWLGEVAPFPDDDDSQVELQSAADRIRTLFDRVARAARTIADDRDSVPELPEAPELVAYAVAAVIDLALAERQALLATPSPLRRLTQVEGILRRAVAPVEESAIVHRRARTNGRGHHADGEAKS